MERSGAIEDRLMAQQLMAEARRSQLKLQTEAEEMQELKFAPETGRGKDGERRVDVREVSQRLHQGAGRRDERQRQLQVGTAALLGLNLVAVSAGEAFRRTTK
jgi:hypothetical protein